MTEKKKLFRRVLDAIVEGRTRQARQYVDLYTKNRSFGRPSKD